MSTTAREAADWGFKTLVVRDACATLSEQVHQANLDTLQVFGWVQTAEEDISLMRKGTTT